MRFGDCTYQEIAALAGQGAVAVVPPGCTEQQGPRLPVDFDTWFAEAVVTAGAGQAEAEHGLPVLVLPALAVGPAPEHRSFGAGYLDLPVAVHEAVVRAILDSLCAQGFKVTVVWRGCGGHDLRRLVVLKAAFVAPFHSWQHRPIIRTCPTREHLSHTGLAFRSRTIRWRPGPAITFRVERPASPARTPADLDASAFAAAAISAQPERTSCAVLARLPEQVDLV